MKIFAGEQLPTDLSAVQSTHSERSHKGTLESRALWPAALSLARSRKSSSTCEMSLMFSLHDAIHCDALLSVSKILQLALQPMGRQRS